MASVDLKNQTSQQQADNALQRKMACWLTGGAAQRDAIKVAVGLAKDSGAKLTGLSAVNPELRPYRGPLPIGGAFWSQWLAEQTRARMRDAAAAAFHEFETLTRHEPVEITGRHEEGDLRHLARTMTGYDLMVVPAGAGIDTGNASLEDELASALAKMRPASILRVRCRPREVRNIVVIVDDAERSGRSAETLVEFGLWPTASITMLPATDKLEGEPVVDEQAALLRSHGRKVDVAHPIGNGHAKDLASGVSGFDVAVMRCLSNRQGWFGMLRKDLHEITAETVPMTLVP